MNWVHRIWKQGVREEYGALLRGFQLQASIFNGFGQLGSLGL